MARKGFTWSPEFGWFVAGLAVSSATGNAQDGDWFGAAIFGVFAVVLLALLIRDRMRREH